MHVYRFSPYHGGYGSDKAAAAFCCAALPLPADEGESMTDRRRLEELLKHWPIGGCTVRAPLHHKDTVFRVTTGRGATFVLKEVGDIAQAARLASEYNVLLHL